MKNNLLFREFYKSRLSHIQIAGATYFITFRLANSLPIEVLDILAEETQIIKKLPENQREESYRAWFDKYDDYLDKTLHGNLDLINDQVANLVADSIQFRDGQVYDLISFCIMPNHVHLVYTPLEKSDRTCFSPMEILHSLKRYTAREANKILQRNGPFWQHESYDHFIRDDAELERTVKSVLYNPVKANLVKEQTDWKWSYCKYDM